MRWHYWIITLCTASTVFGFIPAGLNDYDLFMNFGPLCTSLNYIKCHDEARSKVAECASDDLFCQCYYIGVVHDQCIKFCSNYHHETLFRLSKLCPQTGKILQVNETGHLEYKLSSGTNQTGVQMGAKNDKPIQSISYTKREYATTIPGNVTSYTNVASSKVIRKGPHIISQNVFTSIAFVILLAIYLS